MNGPHLLQKNYQISCLYLIYCIFGDLWYINFYCSIIFFSYQFEDIGSHGTKVLIYNLWLNDERIYELNFGEGFYRSYLWNVKRTNTKNRDIDMIQQLRKAFIFILVQDLSSQKLQLSLNLIGSSMGSLNLEVCRFPFLLILVVQQTW